MGKQGGVGIRLMSLLNANDFLNAAIGEPIELSVDGLGTVLVRGLTLTERAEVAPYFDDNSELTIQVILRGMVEPKLSPDVAAELRQADNRKMTTIARRILALSADGDEDDLEKKVGDGSSGPMTTEPPI